MFKPIPVAIGLRYLRAKRRNGFISFISLASILGIALGVAALITTLAVMSGFQQEIRDRMLQMAAHATVSAFGEPLDNWQQAVDLALTDPRVAGAAPYVEKEALLNGPRQQPAMVRGVVPADERTVSVLGDKMVSGTLESLVPVRCRGSSDSPSAASSRSDTTNTTAAWRSPACPTCSA